MSLGFTNRSRRTTRAKHYNEFVPRPRYPSTEPTDSGRGSLSAYMRRRSNVPAQPASRYTRFRQPRQQTEDVDEDTRYAASSSRQPSSTRATTTTRRARSRVSRSHQRDTQRSPESRRQRTAHSSQSRRYARYSSEEEDEDAISPPRSPSPPPRQRTTSRSTAGSRRNPRQRSVHSRVDEDEDGQMHEKDLIPTRKFRNLKRQGYQKPPDSSLDDTQSALSQDDRIARSVRAAQHSRVQRRDRHREQRAMSDEEDAYSDEEPAEPETRSDDIRSIFLQAYQDSKHTLTDLQITELAKVLFSFVQDAEPEKVAKPTAAAAPLTNPTVLKAQVTTSSETVVVNASTETDALADEPTKPKDAENNRDVKTKAAVHQADTPVIGDGLVVTRKRTRKAGSAKGLSKAAAAPPRLES